LQPAIKILHTRKRQVHSELRAIVLHLMGIDHTRLTYKFLGREFRLTDAECVVMKKLVS
jgi:hypothetical protein